MCKAKEKDDDVSTKDNKLPPTTDNLARLPDIRGGKMTVFQDAPSMSGDQLIDSLASQILTRLDADRQEADDLYEAVREMAEGHSDDASMQRAAIEALKVRNLSTEKALKVLELVAKVKLSKERREGGTKSPSDGGELVNIIQQVNDEDKKL